jgi:hypothetical protein
MNHTEAKIIANYLLGNFEFEMKTTVGVLAAVPSDKLAYQPDPLAKSGIGLVRHIVLEDEWLLNSIADGQFNPPPDDSDACGIMTPADGIAQYQAKLPAALARVRAMSAEQLTRVIDLRNHSVTGYRFHCPRSQALGTPPRSTQQLYPSDGRPRPEHLWAVCEYRGCLEEQARPDPLDGIVISPDCSARYRARGGAKAVYIEKLPSRISAGERRLRVTRHPDR